jgi:hypothetical protein
MEAFQNALVAEQADRNQLDTDRLIREQQEQEFEASLQADREKQAKRTAELDAAEAAVRAEKERAQAEVEKGAARERDLITKRTSLKEPPSADFSGPVARLRFKFPGGQQTDRSFAVEEATVQELYDFVDIQDFGISDDFSLFRNAPRREISAGGSLAKDNLGDRHHTLAAAGFAAGSERIMVQDNSA